MVGPASLRTKKALLTRYCNNLSRVIERIDSAHTAAQASSDDATSPPRIKASLFELDATAKLAADALNAFTAALDEIDELPEEQDKQANDYIDSSLSLIERARLMAIELDAKNIGDREENDERGWTEMMRPKLPPIPIPIFTGKLQEYTNFWTLFESNVDRQPLTNLQKFNYLLTALRGEPRELIKRYPITEANYTHAIQLLRDKYGDESKLIADLQSRLEMTKADNKSIYAQRRLLEQILPIVTQLEELGITLNGSYPTKKLLSKFSYTLQRQVLERCLLQNKKETDWIMRDVLSELDDLITTQEQISEMIDSIPNKCDDRSRDSHNNNRSKKFLMKNATTKPDPNACMFCGSTQHKSADCTRIPSIHQRRTYMQQHRRCLNCGKEGHFVKDCTSKGCRYCTGMKHHHTLCPQRHNLGESTDQTPPRARTNTNTPQNRPPVPNVPRNTKRHVKTAVATAQPVQTTDSSATYPDITDTAQHSPQDTSILQNSTVDALDNKVLLLTGVARVRDEARDDWKEVEILFDTGADQSFISSALAEELNLKCTKEKELTMYTFGSTDPKPTKCRHTTLDLWDNQGQKHPVRLCTTPVLTSKGQTTQLDHADLEFVAQHNIHLSKPTSNSTSIPQILLGCDQLWGLLDAPLPRFKLPSGLLLIPSKLGYLLTGKQHTFHGIEGQQNEVNISMITMVQAFTESEDEMSRWDRYWTMDSAGICEFTGTKNEEKTAVNEQVVMFFNNTIERRPDGYYVRLPYKDNHPPLPDNRQIALKRLQEVIRTLKSSPQLLQDYENTFHTQLEKGIIEQIPNNQPGIGPIVHYIPHQPVVTPHKETTKLRIVFDASSHYKECPSLNDILHQGPLVLPDLYAMLLRFRMLPYVAISDVEKAFLQVHLNEMDRDATRFIWVRDVDLPVTEDNIVTYRFTRVTFGLNVSPFLLAGTVTYHLHHVVENKELAKEIKDNLYVDNLILAARTPEDLAKKVVDSREIFQDMGMNLREFLANDVNLKDFISQEACAKAAVQKVLGIEWNATGDYLSMCCTLPFIGQVTKRIVARQIAAVYDPLGWLVPLLTQAKHFQQTLWKHKFEWDNILPASLQEQWQKITQNINGFARTFPRRFFTQPQDKDTCIAVFADASDIAMSTCAYLFDGKHSALVMAKCKLPSIKTTTTMPKMEMNALTMAARLTWSVYQAMKEPWPNMSASPPQIVILSDSQIALSWLTTSEEKASPGVLISNRIKEIRKITAALNDEGLTVRFAYVNTKDNPADAGTRGLNQEQLQDHPWWTGPDFLRTPINHWPTIFYPYDWQGTHETEELQPPTEAGTVSITMNSASTRLLQESCNDLINALRRFVARRGVPDSITCDNAPSFLLGASILAGSPRGETLSSSIHNATSNQEIQWNHITPYAPWQGGFYERLIKSVKHALYKSLRGTNHRSGDHLRTILTEIEACLNSRPLTYQGDGQEDFSSIRPIDFLQKDLTLTLPTTHLTDPMTNDPDYHTPDEIRALQTRQEVIASLQSSCGATERFWTIWQKHYLTCLRETHRRTISSKRQGRETPTIGDVVLVSDPVIPRNEWKLARITDTRAGRDGEIREVELLTPARRKIRRPPNLLIPLEIQPATTPSHTTPGDHAVSDGTDEQIPTSHPYNLRPRRAVHYADEQVVMTTQTATVRRFPPKWFLFYIMIITLFTTSSTFANRDISMTCSNEGVLVHTSRNDPFEICADHHCQMITPVTNPFLVKFPPEVTLHDYLVSLKWNTGDQLATMETMCHRLNFCQQLDCWICSTVVFNPECWPMGAIVITALLLYVIVAILYVLLYVPMTMGKPIRIILIVLRRILLILASALIKLCMTLCRRMRRRRPQSHRDRLLAVLAITLAVSTYAIHACQQVNVLEHRSTVCNNYDGHESCSIYLNELLKINTFHREACLRLTRNATLIANVKLRWKGLYLHCEQESRIFTRAVELQRIDSKRCPHMGSCQGQKCAAIHHSSLIPELEEGNKYPGRTGCMESCGGPGCDCFFLSSGCLFYRVYAVPKNSKVYEIFRCTRWTEQVKLEVTIEDLSSSEGKRRYVLAITPNVPTEVPSMTVTMTAVTLPPLPNLSKEFVTDGRDVAIWNNPFTPDLLCASWRHARDMNCTLKDDCRCHAAENSVSCACPTKDILAYFKQLNLVLPVKTASWELSRRLNETVTAKISQMVSADFVVQFKTVIETANLLVTNNVCNIANSELEGCYYCAKGATAKVTCRSSTNTLGEVLCGRHAFVVPCAPTSPESNLYFHLDSARQLLNCSIRCGETVHYFVLSGILRYTSNFHAAMTDFIQGNTTAYHGFQLPDFHHILNVFMDWYKVLFVSILAVIFALLVSYLCLQSLGIRLMTLLLRGALTLVCYPVRLLATTLERFRTPRPNRDAHEKWL